MPWNPGTKSICPTAHILAKIRVCLPILATTLSPGSVSTGSWCVYVCRTFKLSRIVKPSSSRRQVLARCLGHCQALAHRQALLPSPSRTSKSRAPSRPLWPPSWHRDCRAQSRTAVAHIGAEPRAIKVSSIRRSLKLSHYPQVL
ncbi:hypothetical protein B0H12DRAFT_1163893 [Mycena haematopus]|nr:hypothetical protein B0H12DRAFT_1163893 [Mycena haematopus]